MREGFYITGFLLSVATTWFAIFYPVTWIVPVIVASLYIVGIFNTLQPNHTILRNFPVIGYFRYFFEFISPEIQQYFIERNTDGRPYSRNERALAYRRSKNVNDTTPFGTQLDLEKTDYEGLEHSIYASNVKPEVPKVRIGGTKCTQPYEASILNISAMSLGSLSKNAILALSSGAAKGGFYLNTGEGSLTPYHLKHQPDVVWQIGTGYFGCRTSEGEFDPDKFTEKAARVEVKMIELKLSQGAKPGHGGVLPGHKNTPEIAEIRGVEPYQTILSPPGHKTFSNAEGLLSFIDRMRNLAGGKPVGFKLCIGQAQEFEELCQVMKKTGLLPDFITIDGAEGGTGAAPLEFSDSVGIPLQPALLFVNKTLVKHGLRQEIKIIASGKILSAASVIRAKALGADLCNCARGFMFALGCIQALKCNTNQCPTGVATQNKMLMHGLVVKDKAERVYYFHRNTVEAVRELLAATGKVHIDQVDPAIFVKGYKFQEMEKDFFAEEVW
jgi:glutamate synthase domain-containing protein 2